MASPAFPSLSPARPPCMGAYCLITSGTMDASEIRSKFADYFTSKGHARLERAPLILKDDPTTLFTSAGMQPLLPYLLGQPHPEGTRLTDVQPCFRAQDLEDVGDSRHTTFFEMLGNWSLGDYFKDEQIHWFFNFLVDEVGLDPSRLYVTVFAGNDEYGIPQDDEAARIWQGLFESRGIEAKIVNLGDPAIGDERGVKPGERIFMYDDSQNWWSRGGGLADTPIGDPCGPDSEVFYDFGEEHQDPSFGKAHPASDGGRFMEIGNQVFMQYRRNEDGTFQLLDRKNVDFGGGLERIAAAASDTPDIFKISLLQPTVAALEGISGATYEENTEAMRVIADHLRAAVFLAADGDIPSNKEQGYVLRRLIRRAVRYAHDLGVDENMFERIVPTIVATYSDSYPFLAEKEDEIVAVLVKEERAFRRTLNKGLKEFKRHASSELTGEEIFTLYDTYGFPKELSVEEAVNRGVPLAPNWEEQFQEKMEEQRNRSRGARKNP